MSEMQAALGVKLRLAGPSDPLGYKRAGEDMAEQLRGHAREIWIWVYGHDMDVQGPAVCVSYVSTAVGPITQFMDPTMMRGYYFANGIPDGWN